MIYYLIDYHTHVILILVGLNIQKDHSTLNTEWGVVWTDLYLLATRMYLLSLWKSIWPVSWHFGVFEFSISCPTYFETAGPCVEHSYCATGVEEIKKYLRNARNACKNHRECSYREHKKDDTAIKNATRDFQICFGFLSHFNVS